MRGLLNTILLGASAIFFGGILGVLVCLVRLYAAKPFRLLAVLYTDIFRAIPVLVVLILVYYALPFAGIVFSSFVGATIALALVLAAYTAEVVRAGSKPCRAASSRPAMRLACLSLPPCAR
nr:ABC transporter permease subunit [Sulfitobacter faviae]